MELNLRLLKNLLSKRGDEIEVAVKGTGYLVKTVIGVGIFLLDNEGDLDLLSAKQRATYDKFLKPLLDTAPADSAGIKYASALKGGILTR